MPKILIVEDEADLRYFLTLSLKREKFETLEAETAEEALEILKREKPDLILLDLLLPRMSGYEFLEEIKKNPNLASIPVLVLSNLGQEEEIERALKLGAVEFLVKANFTLDQVVQKIKEILIKI